MNKSKRTFKKTLKRTFKLLFVPHEHNDFQPHFFREFSVLSIIIVAIVLLSVSASTILYIKSTDMTATVFPAVLVDLTNETRTSNHEQTLTRSPILDNVAKLKAEDMAKLGYFAHTSPQGLTPWHWFDQGGYYFQYAGENLAINFTESIDVENAWLNSPTHKANILSDKFTEIGIATVDGTYQGSPTTYVVQVFGKPSLITTIEAKTTQTAQAVAPTTIATTTPKPTPAPVTTPTPKPTPAPKPTPTPAPTQTPTPATPTNTPANPANSTVVAVAPVVKGESTVADKDLIVLTDTKEFIAVKNNAVAVQTEPTIVDTATPAPKYSTWHQRFIFMTPEYTNRIYHVLIWLIIIALIFMIFIQVRRQHAKNIIYGVLLLVIILCLIYINKTMFVTNFLI